MTRAGLRTCNLTLYGPTTLNIVESEELKDNNLYLRLHISFNYYGKSKTSDTTI